jgi:uncharacterized membrane protein YbhN (UPF0104 family)
LLPVRLGEVVRPWLLSRRSHVSFANVVGNIVVEKTLDSVLILFYILVGLLTVENLPIWVRRAPFSRCRTALLVSLVLLFWWRGGRLWTTGCYIGCPTFRRQSEKDTDLNGGRHARNSQPDPASGSILVSLVLWFLPILSSYIMILAFDLHAPLSAALVVFIFVGFGTALPNLPGMIGPYQYACQLALSLFGVSDVDGLAYGLVLNAVQFFTLIAQGLVALPIAGVSIAEIRRVRAEAGCPELRLTE